MLNKKYLSTIILFFLVIFLTIMIFSQKKEVLSQENSSNNEEVITEESVTEESITEESVTEESITEESITEESITEESVTEESVTEVGNKTNLYQQSLPLDTRPIGEVGFKPNSFRAGSPLSTIYMDSEGSLRFIVKSTYITNSSAKVVLEIYNGRNSAVLIDDEIISLWAGPDKVSSKYSVSIESKTTKEIVLTSNQKSVTIDYWFENTKKSIRLVSPMDTDVYNMDNDSKWYMGQDKDNDIMLSAPLSAFGNGEFKVAVSNNYLSDIFKIGNVNSNQYEKFAIIELEFVNTSSKNIQIEKIGLWEKKFGQNIEDLTITEVYVWDKEIIKDLISKGFLKSEIKPSEKVTLKIPYYLLNGETLVLGIKTTDSGNLFIVSPETYPIVK